jgi:Mlc titration factor MtfA (ptsG expression regulator)
MLASLRNFLGGRAPPIPEPLWEAQLRVLPLLARWNAQELHALRELSSRFLGQKSMTGAAGLELSPAMQLHIAVQACLPILHLGLHWYRGWHGVVVYPAAFRVRRLEHDASGLVHEIDDERTGEAWADGPVILSWEDAAASQAGAAGAPAGAAGNVVIHEFAHKLDLLDGQADGTPPFDRRLHPGLVRADWQAALEDAYERFCAELDLIENEIPANVDPESSAADRYYAALPLDPYAATDPAEFFAVSSEAYFLQSPALENAFPHWHALLQRFYRAGATAG